MRRFTVLMGLVALLAEWHLSAQPYAAVKGKIMTSWGHQITPENAWREYPRPQLKRKEWQNLNGLWKYVVALKEANEPKDFGGEILVPFAIESALSGVGKSVTPGERIWYKRNFELPVAWKGQNVVLHFDAVDWECSVKLNGKLVGTHQGGSTAFSFDITSFLKKGTQELVVSVWDPTDSETQARGKQVLDPKGIWYTAVTGIWKTVWLEPVSKTFIQSVYPVSDVDKGKVTFHTGFTGIKGGEKLKVRVLSHNNLVTEQDFAPAAEITLDIPSPKLWSPDSPELYQVEMLLTRSNEVLDKAGSYFAMRKVSISKDEYGYERILLNNEPVFQYGTLDQGWWPDGLLTPPSAEAMRYDMEMLKKMGFNMLRKHIKVEPSLYYYYADSLGLLLWQDMVSGFASAKSSEQHIKWNGNEDWNRPAESARQFEYEIKETMDQLRFFQSIVTWVIFNEGWGQYETQRVVKWSMDYDKTRIIDGVSGWADRNCGNLNDAHQYPGPGMQPAELNPGRVIVLGEFGGLGLPVEDHLWNPSMRNWGYRTYTSVPELIKEYTKLMHNLYPLKYKGLSAAVYTQTTDVEGEVNGLMTYDRKVIKIDPELLRILHAPLYSKETKSLKAIIPDAQLKGQEIRFSDTKPANGWPAIISDDQLKTGSAPVEIAKGKSLWTAWSFDLTNIPQGIFLHILAYGEVNVYLNGNLVLSKRIISKRQYEDFNISEFSGFLKKGKNLIAVDAVNFEMKSSFDFGLYSY